MNFFIGDSDAAVNFQLDKSSRLDENARAIAKHFAQRRNGIIGRKIEIIHCACIGKFWHLYPCTVKESA
jgi:hypothetical protein